MIDLETLGMTQEQLQDRVVDAMASRLLTGIVADEDGDEVPVESQLSRRLRVDVQKRIDQAINDIAEKHILPNVKTYLENLSLKQTNRWGEPNGKPLTFIEYLTERAQNYMTEEVSWDGKAKGQDSYQWKGAQTRIAYMVHSHLTFVLDSIIKETIKNANDKLVIGIQETCKIKLKEIADTLQVSVKTAK